MTVRNLSGYIRKFTGLMSDVKPTMDENSTHYLPIGSEFYETDARENWLFDGNGTWNRTYAASRYYLDSRITIPITTTSSHLLSGGSIVKYGEQIYQYTYVSALATGGTPTRTISIVDSNSVAIFTSTAITESTAGTTVLPGITTRPILEGTYTVVIALSTNSASTSISDYLTLGFYRG